MNLDIRARREIADVLYGAGFTAPQVLDALRVIEGTEPAPPTKEPEMARNVIDAMHNWVADWAGVALNDDTLNHMNPEELADCVEQHYDGGVNQFMADCA